MKGVFFKFQEKQTENILVMMMLCKRKCKDKLGNTKLHHHIFLIKKKLVLRVLTCTIMQKKNYGHDRNAQWLINPLLITSITMHTSVASIIT